jgi:hypothetical protein
VSDRFCYNCGLMLRWNNDYDISEEDEEFNICSMWACDNPSCGAWYEIYLDRKDKEKTN